MTNIVTVSGCPPEPQFGFLAPSSQWGVILDASLVQMQASFGFNLTPHNFSLTFIPTAFNGASGQLPTIGTATEMSIGPSGQFYIKGRVSHSDYTNASNGTSISVQIQDDRKYILDQIKITSEDLGDTLPSGVVSVAKAYREINGLGTDAKVEEYRQIQDIGATYQQILEAIDKDTTFDVSGILPSTAAIAANLDSFGTEPLRFKFTMSPLSQVISSVCSDSAYDWYWGMADNQVKLVNRKVAFAVDENSLAVQQLQPDSTNFKFGVDEVNSPDLVSLLGGHQEGFINSDLLSSIDGLNNSDSLVFTKAWTDISISFYDAFGAYRTYLPTETELKTALKSIEHWTYYLLGPAIFADPADSVATTAASHPDFQSRLDPDQPLAVQFNNPESGIRIISNRRDKDQNWILEWYSRVAQFANQHYGKTYKLEGYLFDETDGEYVILDAAWCNLENQKTGSGVFDETYNISSTYFPISPFITDNLKVRAHAVMPGTTKYGPDGVGVPASFAEWNEDASGLQHYIPVDVRRVGQKVRNPRNPDNAFETFPEGTIIANFPVIVGTGLSENAVFGNLVTLLDMAARLATSGTQDELDPTTLIHVYEDISGIAVPVSARRRYGQVYPAAWQTGAGSGGKTHSIVVDDKFAPWNYFPLGQDTSVDIMSQRASGFMNAKLNEIQEIRFAEMNKVGWPVITFDAYAGQAPTSGIYGIRDNGITSVGVSYSNGVPQTKYGIKSHFTEFGKDASLGERNFGDLNSIIHPIDYTSLDLERPESRFAPTPVTPVTFPFNFLPDNLRKEVYAVTITNIDNRGSTSEPEQYFSLTKDNTSKPGGGKDPLDDEDLICRDGFLNIGDPALYIVEYDAVGARRRYYTGGTSLEDGAGIVEVVSKDYSVSNRFGGTSGEVEIGYRGFTIPGVAVASGVPTGNVETGTNGTIMTDGSPKAAQGTSTSLRPDVDAPGGVYFVPVPSGGAGVGAAIPVLISGITGFGTSGATADVVGIIPSGLNGQYVGSGAFTSDVNIIPVPAYATSGDIGILAQNSDTGDQFVYISRFGFKKWDG
jgi:hypothetical protein